MKKLVWLFLPFLFSCGKTPDPRTLWHNRQAVKFLNGKNNEASQQELLEAFQYDPYQPELHLNLGLNLELRQDTEKALQQYGTAERYAENPFQKFVSRFNRAQLLGRQKKTEEALQEYQRALEIAPTSKEAKTNIELLMQSQQGQSDQQQQNNQNNQDQKDQKQDQKDQQNKDDQKKQDEQKDNKDQKKEYKPNSKYQPREFKGELSPSDVKKILDEIKQQEQKIRAEYNKKNEYKYKERPNEKDW